MNKIFKNIAMFICISFIYSSCDTVDFGNTNVDPNSPTAAVTSQLLTQAQRTVPGIVTNLTGILYTQQLTEGQYPGRSKYETLTSSYNGFYTGSIQNLNRIIELNLDESTRDDAGAFGNNANQIAVSMILRTYILGYMTDRWGGLPWEEAFQGIDFPQPKFNTQEELYTIMFAEIDAALALINESESGPAGDIIFDGDMGRWRLFASSVKMIMAMRISHVNPSLAKTKFEAVISSGNYISMNSDNIEFTYGSSNVDDSPWGDRYKTREDFILSETLMEDLRTNLDPRLFKFSEPSRETVIDNPLFPGGIDAAYFGAENGKVNGNVPDYSFPTGTIIYDYSYPTPIFTAAQMKFTMAEAAMNGWNVGGSSASTLFAEAIEASMDYWGVDGADADAYVAAHSFSGINDIAYEKWVALYLNGAEAWSEWRRLDFPILTPSIYAPDPRIPVRDAYDSAVEDNNAANYAEIVSKQGADDLHTKLWWDVN